MDTRPSSKRASMPWHMGGERYSLFGLAFPRQRDCYGISLGSSERGSHKACEPCTRFLGEAYRQCKALSLYRFSILQKG